VKFCST